MNKNLTKYLNTCMYSADLSVTGYKRCAEPSVNCTGLCDLHKAENEELYKNLLDVYIESNKQYVISKVKVLLAQVDTVNSVKLKSKCADKLFSTLTKNLYFVHNHKAFKQTVFKKLNELKDDNNFKNGDLYLNLLFPSKKDTVKHTVKDIIDDTVDDKIKVIKEEVEIFI